MLTKDMERVNRFVAGFRCGIVWVNCSQPCFTQLPWGGLKRSGFGRDLGVAALDNYCNVKQVGREWGAWFRFFVPRQRVRQRCLCITGGH